MRMQRASGRLARQRLTGGSKEEEVAEDDPGHDDVHDDGQYEEHREDGARQSDRLGQLVFLFLQTVARKTGISSGKRSHERRLGTKTRTWMSVFFVRRVRTRRPNVESTLTMVSPAATTNSNVVAQRSNASAM